MIVDTIAPAPILLFNKEHRNFTESDTYIDANTPIEGEPKLIEGKRKGQPFTYRLFITNDKQIIFLNKTNYKNMNTTEVQLGADASTTKSSTAPSPIKNVCILNPMVVCETDKLSATNARKGSMATLKDASIIITIPAPIHSAGSIAAKYPEFVKKINAILESTAPTKK